jgi:hypothetical protein
LDFNGKDPLVDVSSEWLQSSSERRRATERHRIRRRARRPHNVRSKIRVRIWLACTGALLVMAIVIYLAIGRERVGESGLRVGGVSGSVAALGDGAAGLG